MFCDNSRGTPASLTRLFDIVDLSNSSIDSFDVRTYSLPFLTAMKFSRSLEKLTTILPKSVREYFLLFLLIMIFFHQVEKHNHN